MFGFSLFIFLCLSCTLPCSVLLSFTCSSALFLSHLLHTVLHFLFLTCMLSVCHTFSSTLSLSCALLHRCSFSHTHFLDHLLSLSLTVTCTLACAHSHFLLCAHFLLCSLPFSLMLLHSLSHSCALFLSLSQSLLFSHSSQIYCILFFSRENTSFLLPSKWSGISDTR